MPTLTTIKQSRGWGTLIVQLLALGDEFEDLFDVVAGVDDHGFVRGLVSDDRAVAAQRAYGEDFVDHLAIVVG